MVPMTVARSCFHSRARADCTAIGYYFAATIGCTAACAYDATECTGYCGDDTRDPGQEDCDGVDLGGLTCQDFGFYDTTTLGFAAYDDGFAGEGWVIEYLDRGEKRVHIDMYYVH